MAVDKLVDSSKLNAALDYEARKIIAKGGGTAPLAFDFANEKGFGDYIDAIPSGGGLTKLGTGSHTVSAVSSEVTIPVSYTGTAKIALVTKDSPDTGVGETIAWVWKLSEPAEVSTAFPLEIFLLKFKTTADAITYYANVPESSPQVRPIRFDSGELKIRQYGGNQRIQPGSYTWTIWG